MPRTTLQNLSTKAPLLKTKKALIGLDGFVDKIVTPIDKRFGAGTQFQPITQLAALGQRITAAANKSTNIELFLKQEKLGGNGPLMASGLLSKNVQVKYIGALGYPTIHPVFQDFAQSTRATSICNPGFTDAIECDDGKLLLGIMNSLDLITYDRIVEVMGESSFKAVVEDADLIGLLNWTMIPHLTDFFTDFINRVLKKTGNKPNRIFFVDLSDPEKRPQSELQAVLKVISQFQSYGSVTLSMNLKEACHIYEALGHTAKKNSSRDELKSMAQTIREILKIATAVIHPLDCAVASTKDDTVYLPGYLAEKPLVTTGGGDHFNAGFAMAQLLDMNLVDTLRVAMASSGFYVRTGKSPGLLDLSSFITDAHD